MNHFEKKSNGRGLGKAGFFTCLHRKLNTNAGVCVEKSVADFIWRDGTGR
jgi:hypothetical protein